MGSRTAQIRGVDQSGVPLATAVAASGTRTKPCQTSPMDELQAASVFDDLLATGGAPSSRTVEEVLDDLDQQQITATEADAFEYYAGSGTPVALLAERARRVAAAAIGAALAAGPLSRTPGLDEPETLRRHFQNAVVSLTPSLEGQIPAARARRLLHTMARRLSIGRTMLEHAADDQVDAWMAVRDFVEAAALAALLSELAAQPRADGS